MIRRAASLGALTLVLVPASASAGAGTSAATARPPVALTASPSHVDLDGNGTASVTVTNSGSARVVVDVARAGFALDLRGRPKIVATAGTVRSAAPWIAIRPRSVGLRPGGSARVSLQAKLPSTAEPGDHDALVLFTTRRRTQDGVAVRMRMGVVVVVRAPGAVVRRLSLGRVRATQSVRRHVVEVAVVNRGNVTESFARRDAFLDVFAQGRRIARLRLVPRALRPRTRGLLQFPYARTLHGPVVVRAAIGGRGRKPLEGTYRLTL